MKTFIAVALIVTSAPVLAANSATEDNAASPRERQICTRVELRGASRMSVRRICKTAAEWRQQLGADWRQRLSGAPPVQDQMEMLETRTRPVEN